MDKEDYLKEAREWVNKLDNQQEGTLVPPSWLKIDNQLQYYFEWKSTRWEKGVGWYPHSERIMIT